MINQERLALIPTEGPIVFFRSCMTSMQYPHVQTDTMNLLSHLGYQPHIVQDQTCCAGFSYFSSLTDKYPLLLANARNFALFAEVSPEIVTVCNACFSTLNFFQRQMDADHSLAEKIKKRLKKYKLNYPAAEEINLWHLLELLYAIKEKFPVQPSETIANLKVAVHVGCHYLRPNPYAAIDSPVAPTFFNELVSRIGAEVVRYKDPDLCCGGGWTTRHADREMSLSVSLQKLQTIHSTDATHIVVSCPFCLNVLENAQIELEATGDIEKTLPVWHISQLGLLALNETPVLLEPRK